jgi:hypothetical protein
MIAFNALVIIMLIGVCALWFVIFKANEEAVNKTEFDGRKCPECGGHEYTIVTRRISMLNWLGVGQEAFCKGCGRKARRWD